MAGNAGVIWVSFTVYNGKAESASQIMKILKAFEEAQ